jgi:hypothetical protein
VVHPDPAMLLGSSFADRDAPTEIEVTRSLGKTPRSRKPSTKQNLGVAVLIDSAAPTTYVAELHRQSLLAKWARDSGYHPLGMKSGFTSSG